MSDNMVTGTDDRITDTAFSAALSERYLAYALSTITSRSLPDVRDGLKVLRVYSIQFHYSLN